MSLKTRKAIVFNCYYNGLSIIQELASKGISCIAMDHTRSIGTFSKYGKYIKCPDPLINEKAFVDFLYKYCQKENEKPILFPTNDHWAVAISKHKEKLMEVSIPCVSDWSNVKIVIEKEKFYSIGEERGYLTPKTWTSETIQQIEDNDFPIIAKPEYRRTSTTDANSKNLFKNMDRLRFVKLEGAHELQSFLIKEKKYIKNLVFQEYIQGMSNQMYTVGVYTDQNSEVLGLFTGRKVRGYPADIGDCVVGESSSVPDYVIENTIKIVKELNYKGIAEFEYKKDPNSGKFRLIEINPRSWSWIGITPYCGVNLPWIAYQDLSGFKVDLHKNDVSDGSVRYVKVLQDLNNSLFLYKKIFPKWSRNISEWRADMDKAEKVIFAEFHQKDIKIAIKALLDQLVRLIKIMIKKLFIRSR